MDYGLAGRTIVITGAARGQGAAKAGLGATSSNAPSVTAPWQE